MEFNKVLITNQNDKEEVIDTDQLIFTIRSNEKKLDVRIMMKVFYELLDLYSFKVCQKELGESVQWLLHNHALILRSIVYIRESQRCV